MKYYAVTCNLGHHGSGRGESITFALEAADAAEACAKARKMPGVKHSSPFAIKKLREITEEEYNERRQTSAYENVWADKE